MNAFLDSILKELLGKDLTLITLSVCYIWSGIGAFIHWAYSAIKGVKKSDKSPRHFSFKYWWKNNILHKVISILLNIAVIFVLLRLSTDLKIDLSFGLYPAALIIGYNIDKYIMLLNDKLKQK